MVGILFSLRNYKSFLREGVGSFLNSVSIRRFNRYLSMIVEFAAYIMSDTIAQLFLEE